MSIRFSEVNVEKSGSCFLIPVKCTGFTFWNLFKSYLIYSRNHFLHFPLQSYLRTAAPHTGTNQVSFHFISFHLISLLLITSYQIILHLACHTSYYSIFVFHSITSPFVFTISSSLQIVLILYNFVYTHFTFLAYLVLPDPTLPNFFLCILHAPI